MSETEMTPHEIEQRGEAIYATKIKPQLSDRDHGKFVVIDVVTGEYEIAQRDIVASKAILARYPNAVLYGLRVGHDAAYKLGGHTVAECT